VSAPAQRPPHDAGIAAIRPWQPGDDEAVLQCHNTIFAAGGRMPPRSLAHWRWKFRDNPTGTMMQMLAVDAQLDGQRDPRDGVVGIYGAVPALITCNARRRLGAQAVDVCVRPEWLRQGDGGLFPRLGRAFLDRWLGTGSDQAVVLWGLPVTAWRSGSVHLGYQNVRDWDVTFLHVAPDARPRPAPGDLAVQRVDRFGTDANALFARIEPSLGLATVRDSRYLNWRYADHPDRRYVLFECRERATASLRGLCVYATGDVVRPNTSYLVDWLQPADDVAAMTAMLAAAEQQTQQDGTGLLCSVWNHMDARFLQMQDHGYRVRGTPWFLVAMSPLYDIVFFREQWYFTLGDSDLV
jgi:hypothetical protein